MKNRSEMHLSKFQNFIKLKKNTGKNQKAFQAIPLKEFFQEKDITEEISEGIPCQIPEK